MTDSRPTADSLGDELSSLLHLGAHGLPEALAGRPALVCSDGVVSYDELYAGARRAAAAIAAAGIGAGEIVALWLTNRRELVELYLGCFMAGAVAMPLFPPMNEHEVRELLEHGKPSLLVTERKLWSTGAGGEAQQLPVPDVWTVDGPEQGPGDYRSLTSEALPWTGPAIPIDSEAPATLAYTSGTTGEPKGAVHLRRHHAAGLRHQRELVGHTPDDTALVFLSICHTFGLLGALLPAMSAGATVVLQDGFDPRSAADALIRHRVTLMYGLPAMYTMVLEAMAEHPDRHADTLRNAMIAGDSAGVTLHQRFAAEMGLLLQEGYALTETMMVSANPVDRAKVLGSVGRALPGVEVRIRAEDGTGCAPGVVGEIEVRGDTVMSHYHRNEEATEAAFVDGWLRTGDLGYLDEEGHLWFAGRLKQIIVVGGENISPREVEMTLRRHTDVLEAAVVGVPDAVTGRRLVAFVQLRPESSATAAVLDTFVRRYVTGFKVPARIEVRTSLPTGAVGKIDVQALEIEAAASS